ncbi:MAG: hypothetical protein RL226_1976 [Bacteroidota bacterium]
MKKILFSLISISALSATAQSDILDARTNYSVNDEVTVTGIVTNDVTFGSIRYIQDETAGVAIYPGSNWGTFTEPQPGDIITVTGVLTEFNGLLEVGPSLSEVTIVSSGNPLPDPIVLPASQLNETYEGMLVQVNNVLFEQGGVTIAGNNTYSFSAAGESGVAYVRNGNFLVGELLPSCETILTGVLSQFDVTGGTSGYQVLPRNVDDFQAVSAICFASPVEQTNITTSGFTLEWTTDVDGDSKVEYGLTPALGSVTIVEDLTTSHSVALTGLEAGTIYYARVSSEADGETTTSSIRPYATVSNSSGDIIVYFNHNVNNNVATIENAINLGADLNDTIAAYITRAQHTLDFAIYNINNSLIVDAINTAKANGVQIRYIAHGANANIGIGNFASGIPVLYRPDDTGSGMHNKFVIIDADYEDLAHVITGSTNFTDENLVEDLNNVIIFQDQSIARGYRLEFEEMWGSTEAQPDAANAKFGANKTINTPKKYIVGGSDVEVYFSPTDGTTRAIEEAIMSTGYDLYFSLLAFTRDDLAAAIIEVGSPIFINPIGVIEQVGTTGSEYQPLLDGGITIYSHQDVTGQLHHKYGIIDQSQPLSDPMVITGSHNWSSSAETVNDENTVIVHDARVANLYYQEFQGMLIEMGVNVEEHADFGQVLVYPNPASDVVTVAREDLAVMNGRLDILDASGRVVLSENINAVSRTFDVSALPVGLYILRLAGDTDSLEVRFIRQ